MFRFAPAHVARIDWLMGSADDGACAGTNDGTASVNARQKNVSFMRTFYHGSEARDELVRPQAGRMIVDVRDENELVWARALDECGKIGADGCRRTHQGD